MPGAKQAAQRVKKALQNKEKITIVGDYDVDGVVSAAILEEFLQKHGADVETILPCRFSDGYGLGVKILERVNSSLLITVDNGVAAIDAANECAKKGIELIVIDHHTIGEELPISCAIVHPRLNDGFSFGEICAALAVWYFLAALKLEMNSHENLKEYLDLVAIATIADVMPLKDVNRVVVKSGIDGIKTSKRPAMSAIKQRLAKEEFCSSDIAYKISPRLNSAGRLSLASEAFAFLRAKDHKEALELFDRLTNLNEERKKIELAVTNEALEMANKDDEIIVVAKEGWHEGVVGIVASRLAGALKKPSIVLSIVGDCAKGSARGAMNINIFELIAKNSHFLTKFGGHKMAAGVAMQTKDVDSFRNSINELCLKELDGAKQKKVAEHLGELDFDEIDEELFSVINSFEPYGEGNERPIFLGRGKRFSNIREMPMKIGGFKANIGKLKAVCFKRCKPPRENEELDFRFSVYKNDFTGGAIELLIEEIIEKN